VVKLLTAGAQVTALDVRPRQVLIPNDGSAALPSVSFSSYQFAGLWYVPTTFSCGIGGGGSGGMHVSSNTARLMNNSFTLVFGPADSNMYLTRGANSFFQVVATGGVQFANAALATNFTTGYLTIPSCAGTPTGVPANIPTGQMPIVYDSTNNTIAVYNGGWKQTAALT
jgi:hypothetical protein